MPILKQINGWKPWYSPQTLRNGHKTATAPFPQLYLPSDSFWGASLSAHCLMPAPWLTIKRDIFEDFIVGGGSTSIIGVIGSLDRIEQRFRESNTGEWGIGGDQPGEPTVGYCIGDLYKEHAWFRYFIEDLGVLNQISSTAFIDVFQRSRLKRIYVSEGMVVRFVSNPDPIITTPPTLQYILTLDISGVVPAVTQSVIGDRITIYLPKREAPDRPNLAITLTILKLLPNWEFVVTKPPGDDTAEFDPESGDFYRFSTPLCIEDPYMQSGFWKGAQGEESTNIFSNKDNAPDASFTVYKTTHNCPYDKFKFTGQYVNINTDDGVPILTPAGSPFEETTNSEWKWIKNGNISDIFGEDDNRYFVITDREISGVQAGDADYISPSIKQFALGSDTEGLAWKMLKGVTYARMEMQYGGSGSRQNWHSPILTKCWLKQNDAWFAILGQPEGFIIDVSLRDITNTKDLDTGGSIENYILNQYAWMVNEHGEEPGNHIGFLQGKVTTVNYSPTTNISNLVIEADGCTSGTVVSNTRWTLASPNPNSFYERYCKTCTSSGSGIPPKKMWQKFNHWYVYTAATIQDSTENAIDDTFLVDPDSVVITPGANFRPGIKTNVSVSVYGDMRETTRAGFYFDEPYKRSGQSLPIFSYEFSQAAGTGGFAEICSDTKYISAAISVQIPINTSIGITGGVWWGLEQYGTAVVSPNYNFFVITVPLANKSISSFFNYLSQEDWIFFEDIDTNRITLRTASLNFMDLPRRAEICIGFPESIGTARGFPITFDSNKERVKLISMTVPGEGVIDDEFGPSALTFQIDNNKDYFGFKSTGSGVFDFQALRNNGFGSGTVDYKKYKNKGYFISPVYKRVYDLKNNFKKYETLELGLDTKNTLLCKNGSPSNIKIEYIKDFQTLRNVGFFDVHHIGDGECIIFYGMNVTKFINSNVEITYDPFDSLLPPTARWPTDQCLWVMGSADHALTWGTPTIDNLKFDGDNYYQYPVLLINACEYLTSYYNKNGHYIGIVLKCYNNDKIPFIGFLVMDVGSLTIDLQKCYLSDNIDYKFWFRPLRCHPTFTKNFLRDDSKAYTRTGVPILTRNNMNEGSMDQFIRIMGRIETFSDIEDNVDVIGLMFVTQLNSGMTVILYSALDGIRLMRSTNLAQWEKSKIILAKDGTTPLIVGEHLFYITPEGIGVKNNVSQYIEEAALTTDSAGLLLEEIEKVQKEFDDTETHLIGSGRIAIQRISGHISHDGIYKICYFDQNNILCCLESQDVFTWKMAKNF